MPGAPGLSFTPYKGPEIFPHGDDEPGFRSGLGYHSVIGGDLHEPSTAKAEVSLALGDGATAGRDESDTDVTAVGPGASAQGSQSSAFGASSSADGEHTLADGAGAFAQGTSLAALGPLAYAGGENGIAAGPGATVNGTDTAAFGPTAAAAFDRSFAVGANAQSTQADEGELRADRVVVHPSSPDPHDTVLVLYDAAGAQHVLGVTDTQVTYDGAPIGGGGGGGAWHEDEVDVGPGSTSVGFSLVPDPATISIQVWLNGVLLRRDVDWEYTDPDPGGPAVAVMGLVEGDYVVMRWQEAV